MEWMLREAARTRREQEERRLREKEAIARRKAYREQRKKAEEEALRAVQESPKVEVPEVVLDALVASHNGAGDADQWDSDVINAWTYRT